MAIKTEHIAVVVLAAGLGKRMKSELPKVLHPVRGRAMILRVLDSVTRLNPGKVITVIGHKGEQVEGLVRGELGSKLKLAFAQQKEMLGTGDAVRAALPELADFKGTVLILCGDIPLIRVETLNDLLALHNKNKATLSLLTVSLPDGARYGRIIRDSKSGLVQKIIEAKDCTADQLAIKEINVGVYAVDSSFLIPAIEQLKNHNQQAEFYLTDIVERAASEGQTVSALTTNDCSEALGVNTRLDLSIVEDALKERQVEALIESGVVIKDRASVYIDQSVKIEPGAMIGPNTQILGNSVIASGVEIEGSAYILNSKIGNGTKLKFGVRIESSEIKNDCSVGPFAHLREGTVLDEQVKIGDFVETKKARFFAGAKASHLAYIGDAEVREDANIGAGTITCNYDGYKKSKTKIGKGAFIGSNTALVAPVEIGDGAVIGAGSTIAKNVEADALAFTRAPQLAKSGWAKNRREKMEKSRKAK